MENHLTGLRKLVESIHPLPQQEWNQFANAWKPFVAKRKEVLTLAGEYEKYLYYVIEGVQRIYYYDQENHEATLVFTYSPSFGGVLDAMMLQKPSRYFYETLTPSSFLRAPFAEIQKLMETCPAIQQVMIKGLSNSLSGLLERMVELQCYTSSEKFTKLLQRSPHILQLVPHKYLANYLGIDATNFSKLINHIKI